MTNYKSYKIIDGKAKWVITDENGDRATITQLVVVLGC